MKKSIKYFILIFLLLFATNLAQAQYIVDTGPGPNSGGWTLDMYQRLAGEFSLSQTYNITGIEGWLGHTSGSNNFYIAVYGDNVGLPDNGNRLFYQQASVSGSSYDWYGLSGLNLSLNSGTYWVSFEVPQGSDFYGDMPYPVANGYELANYAFTYNNAWYQYNLNFGVRISGDPASAVPEPTTMLLLGLGLMGLAGVRRKFQN